MTRLCGVVAYPALRGSASDSAWRRIGFCGDSGGSRIEVCVPAHRIRRRGPAKSPESGRFRVAFAYRTLRGRRIRDPAPYRTLRRSSTGAPPGPAHPAHRLARRPGHRRSPGRCTGSCTAGPQGRGGPGSGGAPGPPLEPARSSRRPSWRPWDRPRGGPVPESARDNGDESSESWDNPSRGTESREPNRA